MTVSEVEVEEGRPAAEAVASLLVASAAADSPEDGVEAAAAAGSCCCCAVPDVHLDDRVCCCGLVRALGSAEVEVGLGDAEVTIVEEEVAVSAGGCEPTAAREVGESALPDDDTGGAETGAFAEPTVGLPSDCDCDESAAEAEAEEAAAEAGSSMWTAAAAAAAGAVTTIA